MGTKTITCTLPQVFTIDKEVIIDILHLGLILVSLVSFLFIFYWQLMQVAVGSGKNPFMRALNGMVRSVSVYSTFPCL